MQHADDVLVSLSSSTTPQPQQSSTQVPPTTTTTTTTITTTTTTMGASPTSHTTVPTPPMGDTDAVVLDVQSGASPATSHDSTRVSSPSPSIARLPMESAQGVEQGGTSGTPPPTANVPPCVRFGCRAMPQTPEAGEALGVPLGFLLDVGRMHATVGPEVPRVQRMPLQCSACGAALSCHATLLQAAGAWRCSVCRSDNLHPEHLPHALRDALPELSAPVMDYVDPEAQPMASFVSGSRTGGGDAPVVHVFLLDLCMPHGQLVEAAASLEAVSNQLARQGSAVALVTFANVVSVYELGRFSAKEAAAADATGIPRTLRSIVLPGLRPLSQEEDMQLAAARNHCLGHPSHLAAAVRAAAAVAAQRQVRAGDQALAQAQRCAGNAVDVALRLASASGCSGGARLHLLLGGAPSAGPGALPDPKSQVSRHEAVLAAAQEFYQSTAAAADALGARIDAYICGWESFWVPLLHTLVLGCGGAITSHDSFAPATFEPMLQASTQPSLGTDAWLSVRSPEGVSITHVLGPVRPPRASTGDLVPLHHAPPSTSRVVGASVADGEAVSGAIESVPSHRVLRWGAGVLDQHAALTVYFQVDDYVAMDDVVIQLMLSYTEGVPRAGATTCQRVLRVLSARLPCTASVTTLHQAMDWDVMSVLCGKQAVLTTRKWLAGPGDVPLVTGDASYEASAKGRALIDNVTKHVLHTFGSRHGRRWLVEQGVAGFIHCMYHCSRGVLLGDILQHGDDLDVLRVLFLHSPTNKALFIMRPALYRVMPKEDESVSGAGKAEADDATVDYVLQSVPLQDLALQSEHMLFLDQGVDIFVWIGYELRSKGPWEPMLQWCLQHARKLSAHRWPVPTVRHFVEYSSLSRWLVCRLAPAHKDTLAEQVVSFPALEHLTPEQRRKLMAKFPRSDDPSYNQYYKAQLRLAIQGR